MTDVFKDLDDLIWRGFAVPLTARSMSFSQGNAKHRIQYRNGQYLESTGTDNRVFNYTIPMREAVSVGLFKDLKPFMDACRDRKRGVLIDPILGLVDAKCISFTDTTDVQKRDGDDIQVSFEEQPPEDPGETSANSVAQVSTNARQLDAEVATIQFFQGAPEELSEAEQLEAEQEASPEPTVNPLDAISGAGAQIQRSQDQVAAKLEDTAFRLRKVEDQIDELGDPNNEPVRRSSRKLRMATIDLSRKAKDPQVVVGNITTKTAKTVTSVATDLGMTLAEFTEFNPTLAGDPFVPAGSVVQFPRRTERQQSGA